MHEYKTKLEDLKKFIDRGLESQNLPEVRTELEKLNAEIASEGFWNDADKAQEVSKKASGLQKKIDKWQGIAEEADELMGLLPEISPEKDADAADDFKQMVDELETKWSRLEVETFLGGKYDSANAILSIHAGTGGTDAQDFAEMLSRMYTRYVEKADQHGENEWKVTILDQSRGDEAGLKSITLMIEGDYSYGYLKGENGVHRLVRLSPFNSGNTRETSFVLVEILPSTEEASEDDIVIDEKDIRVDVFRASGHGGQSVNTTDSAVRITHEPTGIVVSCQNERSQHQNKDFAMKVLKARLADLMEKEQASELSELRGGKTEMSWGNQIRSYVLHPYKMVKDHRTDYEENNPDKVLDGDLIGFVEAELKKG
ncbi:peptide chain release factor 2 [Candidatus Peregrinibacteria bacterium]|jgi:peptide chain release factor 2|nr:peptide chain release factor 2 [Candidatus Peregrinibacteria bacterium]MBT4147866.1 peptide chain release factor 2 [Candidatus Peregrinibacteria bacterium]MBT4366073.1 peptide chain release factor 2 [Candidatus Peregrinibacteria bacterium]